jgi:hypothetical protein
MKRYENAPKLVVVFGDNGDIIEVTSGLPLAGFNPKYAVETYIPTPMHRAEIGRLRAALETAEYQLQCDHDKVALSDKEFARGISENLRVVRAALTGEPPAPVGKERKE